MKVLVAGLGGIGQRHVRNLRAALGSSVEILAYRTRRLTQVITPALTIAPDLDVETEYNLRVYSDLDDALSERPSIAFICNPTSMHVPVALACAHAGCDLFLEKPVSNTLDGLDELSRIVRERKLVAMVGYQLRFHPCYLKLEKALREKVIGLPLAVRATVGEYLPGWHPYEDYRQMYASRADLGGGVILTQIHEWDYLYGLFGVPKRVWSLGGHWSRLEIDVEDVASTLVEFSPHGRALPVHLQQDYVQRPPARGCEVVGDNGKLYLNLAALSVTLYDGEGKLADEESWIGFDRNQLFVDQLKHFLQCVRERNKPRVDLNDGIWSLRAALAAKESMETGRVVTLDA